jgi:hypothetical protein
LPVSAAESISLAVEHTRQQLFRPFRIGQWTRLAFVGLLAGELGANGCNRANFHLPGHGGAPPHIAFPGFPGTNLALVAALISFVVIASLAVGIILMYLGSVMRFVLFDSIIAKECHIRWSWSRRLGPGWRYFVWRLLFIFLTVAGIVLLVGIPLAYAFTAGWLRRPKDHMPALVLGAIILFLVLFVCFVATAVVLVLTKDFVVPQMALEDIDATEGWRRLLPMMKAEKGAYTAYIAIKIALALVAGILIGIATIILGLIIAIPSIAFGILAVLTGKAAGLTWNPGTIALAVLVACFLLAIFLYLVALVSVPVIVFFPAYSIYFFASRYPRLSAALNPATPAPQVPPGVAPAPL